MVRSVFVPGILFIGACIAGTDLELMIATTGSPSP